MFVSWIWSVTKVHFQGNAGWMCRPQTLMRRREKSELVPYSFLPPIMHCGLCNVESQAEHDVWCISTPCGFTSFHCGVHFWVDMKKWQTPSGPYEKWKTAWGLYASHFRCYLVWGIVDIYVYNYGFNNRERFIHGPKTPSFWDGFNGQKHFVKKGAKTR